MRARAHRTEVQKEVRIALVNIKKRDGSLQKFDKHKLKSSIIKAGAQEGAANTISDSIANRARDGMKTEEIKRQATDELRNIDPIVAQEYEALRGNIPAD